MERALEPDEAEIVRIMSKLPEFSWLNGAAPSKARHELNTRVSGALREYYLENTRGTSTGWTEKFRHAGISEDDGKSAISCARRLGIDIA
ncbi:MAG TPA: hypothetical protein VLF17_06420 [Candidatus Nitrosotenuis sp.]|nr:hypothetical protein [Candidatus Nitrosotenuis sp.]